MSSTGLTHTRRLPPLSMGPLSGLRSHCSVSAPAAVPVLGLTPSDHKRLEGKDDILGLKPTEAFGNGLKTLLNPLGYTTQKTSNNEKKKERKRCRKSKFVIIWKRKKLQVCSPNPIC